MGLSPARVQVQPHAQLWFTNGKGASKKAALASALGEYFERLSTNYFFADFYLGRDIARGHTVKIGVWVDGAMPNRAETVRGYVQAMHLAC